MISYTLFSHDIFIMANSFFTPFFRFYGQRIFMKKQITQPYTHFCIQNHCYAMFSKSAFMLLLILSFFKMLFYHCQCFSNILLHCRFIIKTLFIHKYTYAFTYKIYFYVFSLIFCLFLYILQIPFSFF